MPGDRGNTTGSYTRVPGPGRRISANNSAAPPQWPTAFTSVIRRSSMTASTSSTMRSQVKSIGAGVELSPAAEVERPAVGHVREAAASGAQIIPWNPVGWQNSSGGPSPPRSMKQATPSVEGTCRMGHAAMLAAFARSPTRRLVAIGRPDAGAGRRRGGTGCEPGLLRGVRGSRPGRHVRRVGARRRRGVHPSGLEDAARLGRSGRVLVRPCSAGRNTCSSFSPTSRCTSRAAVVTLDENLIGEQVGGTVAAVNMFRRIDGRWRMVLHHGSPVAPAPR